MHDTLEQAFTEWFKRQPQERNPKKLYAPRTIKEYIDCLIRCPKKINNYHIQNNEKIEDLFYISNLTIFKKIHLKILSIIENYPKILGKTGETQDFKKALIWYERFLTARQNNSIEFNVLTSKQDVLEAENKKFLEGFLKEKIILQKKRNRLIVKLAKERDNYTCQACGFFYDNKIVEAHHIKPLSIINKEYVVKPEHLITLCPNCHSFAHLLLNRDSCFENKDILIEKLQKISWVNSN